MSRVARQLTRFIPRPRHRHQPTGAAIFYPARYKPTRSWWRHKPGTRTFAVHNPGIRPRRA